VEWLQLHPPACSIPERDHSLFQLTDLYAQLRSVLVFEAGAVFKIGNYCGELAQADGAFFAPEVAKGTQFSAPSDVWVRWRVYGCRDFFG
jgi:hypothetical protein